MQLLEMKKTSLARFSGNLSGVAALLLLAGVIGAVLAAQPAGDPRKEIADALKRLGADADQIQPLFITVDPLRDTPSVMGNYTRSFDPRIVGLTGTPQQIAAVAQEYGVYYAPRKSGPGAEDYVMDHGTYLYLMDPEGRFVRGFDADTPGDRLAEAVRSAMAKTSENASH